MGRNQVNKIDEVSRSRFIKHLLDDLRALELLLQKGRIENNVIRIGAEQEFCLVNANWRPSRNASQVLKAVDDSHFTHEIAKYNLEINLDPEELRAKCFSQMENKLKHFLAKGTSAAEKYDTKILLTGILPTISLKELSLDFMTPSIRYELLNDAVKNIRKQNLEFHIRGVDELSVHHDSVLFEACNTSFQLHLQIPPEDFAASYNWAQAISGPVLGVSANAPLLMGRELWNETRIALFQQSVDTRSSSYHLRDKQPRVTFGDKWISKSILDIYKDDIAEYEILLTSEISESSLDELQKGKIPKLEALGIHNGTIYRWNRPCYGAAGDKAHIRIENRYLPAGPSVVDQMANFAFWVGLMMGRPSEFDDMAKVMDFRNAKDNFIKAARNGINSMMHWKNNSFSTRKLILKELLPIAYAGLEKSTVDKKDIERYLKIIEQRTNGRNGASWTVKKYRNLKKNMKRYDALIALTKTIYENQQTSLPVSDWPTIEEKSNLQTSALLAEQLMSTHLFTVNENDLAAMASSIMTWKNIHHVPVLNDQQQLCGLLTWSHITEHLRDDTASSELKVQDLMVKDVITITPDTEMEAVFQTLEKYHIGCLPVLKENNLVGIITRNDLSNL